MDLASFRQEFQLINEEILSVLDEIGDFRCEKTKNNGLLDEHVQQRDSDNVKLVLRLDSDVARLRNEKAKREATLDENLKYDNETLEEISELELKKKELEEKLGHYDQRLDDVDKEVKNLEDGLISKTSLASADRVIHTLLHSITRIKWANATKNHADGLVIHPKMGDISTFTSESGNLTDRDKLWDLIAMDVQGNW